MDNSVHQLLHCSSDVSADYVSDACACDSHHGMALSCNNNTPSSLSGTETGPPTRADTQEEAQLQELAVYACMDSSSEHSSVLPNKNPVCSYEDTRAETNQVQVKEAAAETLAEGEGRVKAQKAANEVFIQDYLREMDEKAQRLPRRKNVLQFTQSSFFYIGAPALLVMACGCAGVMVTAAQVALANAAVPSAVVGGAYLITRATSCPLQRLLW